MSEMSAFGALSALETQSRQVATPLPALENAQTHWNGLGFSLLGQRFVAPMEQVAELMRLPASTRLPGVKPFVVGIANVRGRLMAILDLATFFGAASTMPRIQRRVLAVDGNEQYFGLMVDESLGMQHFPSHAYAEQVDDVDPIFRPYINGGYRIAGTLWPVMSLRSLAADPELEKLAS